eukprot:CAMPEP_0114237060 /NCGR_PEP_ID=MMETSP0058-20121206/7184_1 /TAXON_ID=36894 /ORGANISM="Pyramimonas parkeae, CCMP726" /LENGTH=366 /DNA_ID=CAMNT_0001349067 /DNA_START=31 /DNA_END=1131 /DNA_ORIENTATION=+
MTSHILHAALLLIALPNLQAQEQPTETQLERLERLLAVTEKEIASLQGRPNPSDHSSVSIRHQGLSPQTTSRHAESCSSTSSCSTGRKCVDGLCRCPVLYTGVNCTEHIQFQDGEDKCAMGFGHPRFQKDYDSKYVDMNIPKNEMTQHLSTNDGKDLVDMVDFTTCAVIGGSGNVLANDFGAQINAHSAVIRFNDAPTESFEQFVGNKTSFRIQNLDFCGYTNRMDELCYAYTAADRPCANWKGWKSGNKKGAGVCVPLVPSHRNAKYIFWYWRMNKIPGIQDAACNPKCGAKMSAGYFGVMLAMNVCSKVDIYGFGSNKAKEQPHYYRKVATWARKDWGSRHHWSFERHCIDQLRAGLVNGVTVH